MLVTEMLSVCPGTPGTMQQMPRMMRSIFTPAQLASLSLSIRSRSVMEFALMTIRPRSPARDLLVDQPHQAVLHGDSALTSSSS